MDRLTALVAIAHAKLRIQYLERHPEILEGREMNPKFAGLAQAASKLNFNLGERSDKVLARITSASARADAAFDKVEATLDATDKAAADIEEFASALEGSNGAPFGDSLDTSAQSSADLSTSVVYSAKIG
jgi:hypothetical protein